METIAAAALTVGKWREIISVAYFLATFFLILLSNMIR